MDKKNFHAVINNHNLYEGLCKDGLLESDNKNSSGKHLYIIGIDISYGTIDYHDFNKFTLLLLSEFQIRSVYQNVFTNKILMRRLDSKVSNSNLLLEILDNNKQDNPNYRIDNLLKYLKPNQMPFLNIENVKDIINIPTIISKYEHIDINLNKDFN
jgi:hypothetical protein